MSSSWRNFVLRFVNQKVPRLDEQYISQLSHYSVFSLKDVE